MVAPGTILSHFGIIDSSTGSTSTTRSRVHHDFGDLKRYPAQVTFAEMTDFGPHHVLSPETRRAQVRLPDEALYAFAVYIYSLNRVCKGRLSGLPHSAAL